MNLCTNAQGLVAIFCISAGLTLAATAAGFLAWPEMPSNAPITLVVLAFLLVILGLLLTPPRRTP